MSITESVLTALQIFYVIFIYPHFTLTVYKYWQALTENQKALPIGGNRGGGNKIIGAATSTSCSPNVFFCNLQSKVTLQTLRLLLTQNSPKFPSFWGFVPDPIVHCVYLFRKIHIDTLNLIGLIVFHQFLLPNRKVVQFLLPQMKNRSRAYGTTSARAKPQHVGMWSFCGIIGRQMTAAMH